MSVKDIETDNSIRYISLAISLLLHAAIIFFVLFIIDLKYDFPPPGKEGVLVMFGDTQESAVNEEEKTQAKSADIEKKEENDKKEDVKDKQVEIEKCFPILKIIIKR